MKTYGYIKRTRSSQDMSLAKEQLNSAGCDTIIYDEIDNNITRPNFKGLVSRLKEGDTLVIYKFANVIRTPIQLTFFLQTCHNRNVRIISTSDRIDTSGCPGENWHTMLMSLTSAIRMEQMAATVARNADMKYAVSPTVARFESKAARNKEVVDLYRRGVPSEEICEQTGVSHTSLFRILQQNGISTNRRRQL